MDLQAGDIVRIVMEGNHLSYIRTLLEGIGEVLNPYNEYGLVTIQCLNASKEHGAIHRHPPSYVHFVSRPNGS